MGTKRKIRKFIKGQNVISVVMVCVLQVRLTGSHSRQGTTGRLIPFIVIS